MAKLMCGEINMHWGEYNSIQHLLWLISFKRHSKARHSKIGKAKINKKHTHRKGKQVWRV